MKNRFTKYVVAIATIMPVYCYADITTMTTNLQNAILDVLAPIVCICGIIFNGFKLAMGDESAKRALGFSCLGTVICFTAPAIFTFLHTRVASGA